MANPGHEKKPLIVLRVQNAAGRHEAAEQCTAIESHRILGIDPGKPEDIFDLERFFNPPTIQRTEPKMGRNELDAHGLNKKSRNKSSHCRLRQSCHATSKFLSVFLPIPDTGMRCIARRIGADAFR
jgi:hypothetical protein